MLKTFRRRSALGRRPCSSRASSTWRPIRWAGLSENSGSCGTRPSPTRRRRPRVSRPARSFRRAAARGPCRQARRQQAHDRPRGQRREPDSPNNSHFPRAPDLEGDAVHEAGRGARTPPSTPAVRLLVSITRSSTCSRVVSRSADPICRAVHPPAGSGQGWWSKMARPGAAAIHHWSKITLVPSATIEPHSAM